MITNIAPPLCIHCIKEASTIHIHWGLKTKNYSFSYIFVISGLSSPAMTESTPSPPAFSWAHGSAWMRLTAAYFDRRCDIHWILSVFIVNAWNNLLWRCNYGPLRKYWWFKPDKSIELEFIFDTVRPPLYIESAKEGLIISTEFYRLGSTYQTLQRFDHIWKQALSATAAFITHFHRSKSA